MTRALLLGVASAGIARRALGGIALSLAAAAGVDAQTISPEAGWVTSLPALGASARADALGAAVVGLADDSSALFFNPAGLPQLKAADLSIHHNTYLAGSFEETLLVGLPAGSLGGFAAALQYVTWDRLDRRDADGVPQGTFSDNDVAFSVGWGRSISNGLSAGLALHGTQQKIADSLTTGLSGDLGFLWAPRRNTRLGLSYTGLGTSQAGFSPAQDLHLGCSERVDLGKGFQVLPLLAGDWERHGVSRIQGGLEGTIDQDCSLRLGYQASLTGDSLGAWAGFTAGTGVRIGRLRLDYAFRPHGDLGTSHRVSVGYEFPASRAASPVPVTFLADPVTIQSAPVTVFVTPTPAPDLTPGHPKSRVEVRFELNETDTPLRKDKHTRALVARYEKAAQANPDDSRAWKNLGIIYIKAGQTGPGLQCLDQALRLNPNDTALKEWLEKYRAQHPDQP